MDRSNGSKDWLAPLTGAAFVVLMIIGFIVSGDEPPDVGHPVNEIVDYYQNNKDTIYISGAIFMLALVMLVFFTSYLSNLLRGPDGRRSIGGPVLIAGAVIFGVGGAIDTTIMVALAEAVDDIEPTSVQALQTLWDNDFVPLALGIELMLFGLASLIFNSAVLPRWLGWIAVVLVIVGFTPVGFFAFPATGLLILIISVMLTLRARRGTTQAAA